MSDSLVRREGTLCKEINALAAIAYQSLQIIVPWRGASANNSKLEKVIQQIQGYGLIYFEAIDISVKTAQNSNGLCSDVIELYGYLSDPETNQDDLQEYVVDLQRKTKLTHGDCTKTLARFGDVRRSLNEMIGQLPKEVTTKDGTIARYLVRMNIFGNKDGNQRDAELDVAMAELDLEVIDVTVLSQGVDAFEGWCKCMEMIVEEAERSVGELSATSGGDGVLHLQEYCVRLLKDYELYKTQIVKVQDQYMAQISAATPQALSDLEINTPHKILNSIVESSYKSMQIIVPWSQASSDHPVLSEVIQDVCRLGLVYYDAIDLSIKTAQDGHDFSDDVIYLCGLLLTRQTNVDDLRQYIWDMQYKVNQSREDCTQTLNKFRNVRQDLNEITKKFPGEVVATDKANPVIRVPSFGGQKKSKREVGLVDAVEDLNLAIIDLGVLSESVNNFTDWWGNMETVLKGVERGCGGLRPGKDQLRVKQLQKTWSGVKEDYKLYKIKIVQLQDYYPSQRKGIRASWKEIGGS